MRKIVTASMMGNALEWYDYALYAQFAVIIAKNFFPSYNSVSALMATFGVFAAGFIIRPIGGILFGYIGDKFGRKTSLSISILCMAIPTGVIGLLPTYDKIGILAPILLTLIRLLQGLSLGGEFGGAMIFLVEHAPNNKRGYIGSTAILSIVIGILAGSATSALLSRMLSQSSLELWGWRIAFGFGFIMGIVGLYIRNHIKESADYAEAKEKDLLSKTPIYDLFKNHKKQLFITIMMYTCVTVPFYTLSVFINSFLVNFVGKSVSDALILNTCGMLALILPIIISGKVSDKIGRKKVMLSSAILQLLLIYPIFILLCGNGLIQPLCGYLLFAILAGSFQGPMPALLVEAFPIGVRYSGVSLVNNFCGTIFGGTAPLINTWLINSSGSKMAPAFYLIMIFIVSSIALYYFKDRYKEKIY